MCAPFGTGMLWVKKENISSLWPLFANDKPDGDDIRKFEALGTRSFPTEQAIGYSLNFHDAIGIERKEARLRYLKNYWSSKAKEIPKVKIHTSLKLISKFWLKTHTCSYLGERCGGSSVCE